ncbi:hypothetical protein M231_06403 [Tremella mesenterica]|uniref:Uncharacterized protein n=1 Tax=Tremella mesenterica TaxID=5217 RepID=A0A4Q1BBW0_TREME|nr:uncharacterized protein TREMEDRAFT_66324 [Tremella mesenterica DSM 1558]EIW65605.1 hypothetical protein TREMEDRAFT_66324 [Tremella mesenterica DSM 1558]RXK36318.1 hypothetical protein M231_06403 [Tremella mesenterica]
MVFELRLPLVPRSQDISYSETIEKEKPPLPPSTGAASEHHFTSSIFVSGDGEAMPEMESKVEYDLLTSLADKPKPLKPLVTAARRQCEKNSLALSKLHKHILSGDGPDPSDLISYLLPQLMSNLANLVRQSIQAVEHEVTSFLTDTNLLFLGLKNALEPGEEKLQEILTDASNLEVNLREEVKQATAYLEAAATFLDGLSSRFQMVLNLPRPTPHNALASNPSMLTLIIR